MKKKVLLSFLILFFTLSVISITSNIAKGEQGVKKLNLLDCALAQNNDDDGRPLSVFQSASTLTPTPTPDCVVGPGAQCGSVTCAATQCCIVQPFPPPTSCFCLGCEFANCGPNCSSCKSGETCVNCACIPPTPTPTPTPTPSCTITDCGGASCTEDQYCDFSVGTCHCEDVCRLRWDVPWPWCRGGCPGATQCSSWYNPYICECCLPDGTGCVPCPSPGSTPTPSP